MIHAEGIEDYTSYLLIVLLLYSTNRERERTSKDVKVIFIRCKLLYANYIFVVQRARETTIMLTRD